MRKLISVFVFQNEHKMAASLRVVLGVDNAAKLTLPNGIPDSIEALKEEIQRKFKLCSSGAVTVQATHHATGPSAHLGEGLLLLVSMKGESGAILLKATDSLTFRTSLEAPY